MSVATSNKIMYVHVPQPKTLGVKICGRTFLFVCFCALFRCLPCSFVMHPVPGRFHQVLGERVLHGHLPPGQNARGPGTREDVHGKQRVAYATMANYGRLHGTYGRKLPLEASVVCHSTKYK